MRAVIVTNMYPSAGQPFSGTFVRDQVEALRRTGEVEVDVVQVPAGRMVEYLRAIFAPRLPRRVGASAPGASRAGSAPRPDIVHAHFGLSAWPSLSLPATAHVATLHGTDLVHPRSRKITKSALPFLDLVATVSDELAERLPRWLPARKRAVLPCGVDLHRFGPLDRAQARAQLGLDPNRRYLLFPADPRRPEKRHERAAAVARAVDAELLALGAVAPERVALLVNAADAVLVTSEREGFGLGVLEALACDVPVLSTPVGIAREALAPVAGTLCAPFELGRWAAQVRGVLADPDPRVAGRASADRYSSDRMAVRVLSAWRALLERSGRSALPEDASPTPILERPGER